MTPTIAARTTSATASTVEANAKKSYSRAWKPTTLIIGFWLAVFSGLTYEYGFKLALGIFGAILLFCLGALSLIFLASCAEMAVATEAERDEGLGSPVGSKRAAAVRAGSVQG